MNRIKKISFPDYNRIFDRKTGLTIEYGKTIDEDPPMSPDGPSIADIEISTICNGFSPDGDITKSKPCAWCYKTNTAKGTNMSLNEFKHILKLLGNVDQVALGLGDIESNPDIWNMLSYSRSLGIIPNLTVNGMGITPEIADKLAKFCGAVACSHYSDKICFNTVKALTDAGLTQVNIHALLSKETLSKCFDLIDKVFESKNGGEDKSLSGLKAIVFLLLKPKGARNKFHPVEKLEDYKKLMDYAREKNVAIGMDSCSAPMALKTLPSECIPSIICCESTYTSIYIDVNSEVFPCSFAAGTPGWETGIDMKNINNFLNDVWFHTKMIKWRDGLIKSSSDCSNCSTQKHCRSCQIYDVTICKTKLVNLEVL